MPEISRFFGIVIAMYYNDHSPPHFHARFAEYEARICIETGAILSGELPKKVQSRVNRWLNLHRDELMEDWRLALQRRPLVKIDPLT